MLQRKANFCLLHFNQIYNHAILSSVIYRQSLGLTLTPILKFASSRMRYLTDVSLIVSVPEIGYY